MQRTTVRDTPKRRNTSKSIVLTRVLLHSLLWRVWLGRGQKARFHVLFMPENCSLLAFGRGGRHIESASKFGPIRARKRRALILRNAVAAGV